MARFGNGFGERGTARRRDFVCQAAENPLNDARAFVDEHGVYLHQVGAGDEFFPGVVRGFDAADANDGNFSLQVRVELADDGGGQRLERPAAQAPDLLCQRFLFQTRACDGRVCGDDGVHAVFQHQFRDRGDLAVVQVRRDLYRHRHVASMNAGERRLVGLERAQQLVEVFLRLHLAQPGRVGRGDVDRDVIGVRIDRTQRGEVIVHGVFQRRVLVLANVDADQAGALPLVFVVQELRETDVVEAHAVDDGALRRQAEQPRFWVARLRARRDRAELQESETEIREYRCEVGVLVEAGGEADRIGKRDAHDRERQRGDAPAQQPAATREPVQCTQQGENEMMAALRIQPEQQLSEQGYNGAYPSFVGIARIVPVAARRTKGGALFLPAARVYGNSRSIRSVVPSPQGEYAMVRKVDYFAMHIPNRAGEAACVLKALSQEGVNLLAFTGFPSGRGSQADFVPANTAAFLKAARKIGFKVGKKKTGFLVQGKDRAGRWPRCSGNSPRPESTSPRWTA